MVLKFAFSNVFSFRDKQEISFEPEALKELNGYLFTPKNYGKPDRFLRALAVYGHNSHGKSNFLKALQIFTSIVKNSFRNPAVLNEIEPFALNTDNINKPSSFEIVFIIDGVKYRYGFEATSYKIVSEWLFHAPIGVKETSLFARNAQDFRISKVWNKEFNLKIETQAMPFAVPNVLLMSVLIAQQNEAIAKFTKAINSIFILKDLSNNELLGVAATIFSDKVYANSIQDFINNADLGFNTIYNKIDKIITTSNHLDEGFLKEVVYEKKIEKFELYTHHTIFDKTYNKREIVEFDLLKKESEGTIKFFILSTLLAYAIKHDQFLIIDELDSKFHSDLLGLIIKNFHALASNSSDAQIIFTSHNTILLDNHLRRDQILLIEKNAYGESKIQPMHTKKTPVRHDTSIEKAYRKGKLGGVSKVMKRNQNDPKQSSLFDK